MEQFTFKITPVEQSRPRATIVKKFDNIKRIFKNTIRMYDPKKVSEYKATIAMLARQQVKVKKYTKPDKDMPLEVTMTFVKEMPKSMSKKNKLLAIAYKLFPTHKPDLSNYIKSTEDGLNGILWEDDNQIVRLVTEKVFGEVPCIHVGIRVIDTEK